MKDPVPDIPNARRRAIERDLKEAAFFHVAHDDESAFWIERGRIGAQPVVLLVVQTPAAAS
jgi:hypothetical protein